MSINMRIELFVEDLDKSIEFYSNIFQLNTSSQNSNSATFKANGFYLLLTRKNFISNNHYFGNMDNIRKGVGVEIIIVVPDIQNIYQRICKMPINLESKLKSQKWGMTDFRLIDPDGYYLRITSPKG